MPHSARPVCVSLQLGAFQLTLAKYFSTFIQPQRGLKTHARDVARGMVCSEALLLFIFYWAAWAGGLLQMRLRYKGRDIAETEVRRAELVSGPWVGW
jgi:hypothetical protein